MAEKVKKKPKREKIPRQPMPEQEAQVRAKNFEEVPFGYTPETAMQEAERCMQCKKPACVAGCPVEVDIPGFIKLIKEGEFTASIRNLWGKNSLPAVCGRVCPQEIQCEGLCIIGKKGDPVAIGRDAAEHGVVVEEELGFFGRLFGREPRLLITVPGGTNLSVEIQRSFDYFHAQRREDTVTEMLPWETAAA